MWLWRISDFEGGRRLADALALRVPAAPAAYLNQFIRKGGVRLGGEPLAAAFPVDAGMALTVRSSSRLSELAAQGGITPAELLFEDRHALVVAKPAGLAVHRAAGHEEDNLTARVERFVALRRAPHGVAPVHRLDVGTSGPVLFGKGRHAAGAYGRLLMGGRIGKRYLALVTGNPPDHGELATPVPDGAVLKPALTRYRRLVTAERYVLLELDLLTGRPHQARRQLADAGWPIVGDRRYGGPAWPGLEHPFLHSHRLSFPLLDAGNEHVVLCPLPGPLQNVLAEAGLALPAGPVAAEEKSAVPSREGL